ncbi:MAG: LapA family protein [Acidimicrobiia bacterium]|nr:LapA family protein [Acidimicrobiia bacterium]
MSRQPTQPPSAPGPAPEEKAGLGFGAYASLTGAALLLIFMLQNRKDVPIHFLFWHTNLPLWFIILGSALLGAIIWLGVGVLRRHRRRVARRRARRDDF